MMISIIIAKLVALFLRLLGKGATTLPGKIALTIKYNLLNYLSRGVNIICVTGTNGKTTTCALIEQGLKASDKSYFINKSGANMITGVATSFIINSTIFGRCKKEYAILECDENSFPIISRYLDAQIVVVTNIFRDQLDRYGEIETTRNKIVEAVNNMPDSVVLLNADCPITYDISNKVENKILTFGIDDSAMVNAVSDLNNCPKCNSKLKYKNRIYAQLGNFYCLKCGYSRVNPSYSIDKIIKTDKNGSSFIMNNKVVNISVGGIYNIYNFLSAYSVLKTIGFQNMESLSSFEGAFGRLERFHYNNKEITMMLVKNPVGFSNCISYVEKLKGDYLLAFALNDNDADGIDVSWIWDVDFTPVMHKATNVLSIGTRAYDMALRLKYNNIKIQSVILDEKYDELIDFIQKYNTNSIIFASYTAMMKMRPYFIKKFGGAEFWE